MRVLRSQMDVKTTEEMFEVLNENDYKIAQSLDQFGRSLSCDVENRKSARYYRVLYVTKNPKRSLFAIECNEKKFRIKANLYHLYYYRDIIEKCSDTIKNCVKKTRFCRNCNPRCIGGASFDLDGESRYSCINNGHYFYNLGDEDWEDLKNLLLHENKIILGIKN